MKKLKSTPAGTALVFLFSCAELFSQTPKFQREFKAIPIIINGDTAYSAFRGGFSGETKPAFVDIDKDGDQDLFVGELDGYISFYRNEGSATKHDFRLVTDRLPSNLGTAIDVGSSSAPAFADIDGDGDEDLFVGDQNGEINYYENRGTDTSNIPIFLLRTTRLAGIANVNNATPFLVKDDANDTYDLFVGGIDGRITRYLNSGTARSYDFRAAGTTYEFGGINVGSYSVPTLIDIGNDGDYDLVVGSSSGRVSFYQREGDKSFAPQQIFPFAVGANSAPALADIDQDGDVDLLVGEGNGFGAEVNIHFYRNPGLAFPSSLRLVTSTFVPIIDVGGSSAPALIDIDKDNDQDLFVGKNDGTIKFYKNMGTAAAPFFELATANPVNFVDAGNFSKPTFADIDKDDDLDLLVGESEGRIKYYENTGTVNDPVFKLKTDSLAANGKAIDVGANSAPTFADIQNDGDADLFVGESVGNINFYRNVGGNFFHVTDSLFGIIFPANVPDFDDIDNDGDFDLFLGESNGTIRHYQYNGASTDSILEKFASLSTIVAANFGGSSAPALADIDDDGDSDLFVGESGGGLLFFRNVTSVIGNRPPVVTNVIANQPLIIGGSPFMRDLNTAPAVFNDPDGDVLKYTARSGDSTKAKAILAGSMLTITAVSAGSTTIMITADDGRGGSIQTSFMVAVIIVAPALTSLNPASGNRLQTLNVTFTGTNFTSGLTVNTGAGITVNSTTLNSSTQLTANLTIAATAATGARNFFVGGSNSQTFTVNNPAPSLTSINPAAGNAGQTLNVVFTGASFFSDATTVAVGSGITVNSVNVTSTTSLTANITISASATTGARNFSVTNAAPGGGTSTTQTFTVQPQTVTLTSISPASGNRLQTLNVVFTGTNFAGGLTVNTGAGITVNSTTLNSATQLTANLTITATAATGARNFSVGSSNSQTFTVSNPAPDLTSINPATGTAGQSLGVVFTGSNFFNDATTVNVGSGITINSINVTSATSLTANITISVATTAGARNFSVTNSAPGGGTSTTQIFTVQPQTVTLTSILPNSGNRLQTLNVVLTGANFTSGLTVNTGAGITVNSTTLNSSTQLTANLTISAAAATGARSFSVGNSNNQTFTVTNPAPTLTEINPATARVGQTLNVVFTGANFFSDATTVNVGNGITVSSVNVTSVTSLTASITIAANATAGGRNFSVSNSAPGGGASTSQTFVVSGNAPPSITHAPAAGPQPENQPITIQANITDDRGIASARLNYRRGGETNPISVAMTLTSASIYQATIPGSALTSRGVEYFVEATDVDNASVRKPETANTFFAIAVQVSSIANPNSQPGGSAQNAYRLISTPLQLSDALAISVLEDDLGKYDNAVWRLYGLAVGQPLTNKTPYVEVSQNGFFVPGKSYFLIVKEAGKTIDAGLGQSLKTDQTFKIPLESGHNFIANPFNFTIPLNKLNMKSGAPVTLLTYDGSFVSAQTLLPWEGYYLANNRLAADTLLVNPNLSSGSAPLYASKTATSGWRIQIVANCAQARDTENFAGVTTMSADSWDDGDLAEPPPIGEYVSVYFPHPEWRKPLERYSGDMRSRSNPNQQWRFMVESNIPNATVTLRFDGLREVDPALAVVLVDEELKYKQNLRENAVYQYQSRLREDVKAFTLIVGKDDFVAEQTANVQGVPENFVLEQNFPNPFSVQGTSGNLETAIRFGLPHQSVATIKIFDLAGHEVATLLDRVELPAGRHQRVWDGRDRQGRAVVSGVYFCRLQAGNFARTRKLMVLR